MQSNLYDQQHLGGCQVHCKVLPKSPAFPGECACPGAPTLPWAHIQSLLRGWTSFRSIVSIFPLLLPLCSHWAAWLSHLVIEQGHQSTPCGSWLEARYNTAQFLSPTRVMLRTRGIKQHIPAQVLLVACWAPEPIYVTQSTFGHMFMPWPLHGPAGLWAALRTLPTHQGPDSPLLYVRGVSDKTPSFHPAKQLSTAETLTVQGGEDRGGLAMHPSTQTWDDAFFHCPVPSHPEELHKALTQKPKRSGSWCAGISPLCNIFGCCAVNPHQSSGRIRPVASGRLPQTCCPGAHPGSPSSHLGQELQLRWGPSFFF